MMCDMMSAKDQIPAVAVITRTKDRPLLIRRAIESVLRQTFNDWVHVIVNDGGEAETLNAITAEYRDQYKGRLQVIHHAESQGMQNASNAAIKQSDSLYLTIHDDDDAWETTFLESCVEVLESEGPASAVQGVVTKVSWIFEEMDEHGHIVEKWRQPYPMPDALALIEQAGENRFPPIAFLYRRKVHERIGYFNHDFTVLGDWDFGLRFMRHYEIEVIPEPLACYHWRTRSNTSAYGNTVTDGIAEHKAMEARFHNAYLRRDLDSGRSDLGVLMNVSRLLAQLNKKIDSLEQQVQAIARSEQETRASVLAHLGHINRITRDLTRWWVLKHLTYRAINVVRERRALSSPSGLPEKSLNARVQLEQFVGSMRAGDILSVDVFDTALLRVVAQPTDIFAVMEEDVRARINRPDHQFSETRRAAEHEARRRCLENNCEDIGLACIYDVWSEMNGISSDDSDWIQALEIQTEKQFCYANPVMLEIINAVKSRGIKVVFLSDMYLPTSAVKELLDDNGYSSPHVYVSGDIGKTKHNGSLFPYAIEALGCKVSQFYHIGDNAHSDLHKPHEIGAHALHIERQSWCGKTFVDDYCSITGESTNDAISNVMTGIVRRESLMHPDRSLWQQVGYEVAGPVMYGFLRWIAAKAQAQGVKKLFFLSRDGYYLSKAYEIIAKQWNLNVDSTYMYASRRLLNLARIRCMDDTALDFLLSPNPGLRVRDFIDRIGLSADNFSDEIRRSGLAGPDAVLTSNGGVFFTAEMREQMKSLLIAMAPKILALCSEVRKNVLSYFADIGFEADKIAIVDVGWQASSIRSLQDLLRMESPDYRLRGYYFGTWCFAQPSVDAGCLIDSYYIHLHTPSHRVEIIAECVELIEHLFNAPHATVVNIEKTDQGWQPIVGTWETTPEQRKSLATIGENALAFVKDMLAFEPQLTGLPTPYSYIDGALARLLRYPTRDEAVVIGQLPHRDSFGGNVPWRHLATPPSVFIPMFRPGLLKKNYENSYWRRGFLAQVSATERKMLGAG
jgi:glycosyltransferase involved in cell wall biosynthesis/FMN phosphatase YigB (HAD superfamily)